MRKYAVLIALTETTGILVLKLSSIQTHDATDRLGDSGCTDASIRGHADGMELLFTRKERSLQAAIASAIADVESAGYRVIRVEMEREAIPS